MSNDPILAVIEEHKRIYKAWRKTAPDMGGLDLQLDELFYEVSDRLFNTAPTTIVGVLALLDYVIGKYDDAMWWAQIGIKFSQPILRSIYKGLVTVRRSGMRQADPCASIRTSLHVCALYAHTMRGLNAQQSTLICSLCTTLCNNDQ